ncbi:TonB-dependent receptor [Mucilaginibacter sp. Bleaf8]|uniref:outer membrane beta-barrel family protein n=1 Tax=Mucilaginibacter sp. Bleaf8 TaxID=2834430 RepID=UPI001BCECA6D|nr:outer membrane beta-barrel family protein [Mucilaginibacter sp. Bleaf8]MBS7566371.1 TonB-dependent receptor [Mucilaginibacter sp. Bleaf8]
MKHIFTFLALLCSIVAAKAQIPGGGSSITGKISGTVIDSVTKKPLDYATISVFRSGGKAPLNGVLTDEKGKFSLNNIAPGKYKIAVSFIGYPTKTIDPVETTPGKPDNNMGTIVISPSSRALKEVVVAGQAPVVENRIDKIVYNAEKDVTSAGGNATDILRKVPLVSVDLEGNVSLRGDRNVRVLINGKPSGALSSNLADVLRTIPADQIKNIEVITSPSAKYDAEGSGGIINIITKNKNVSGLSGSISGGIGTRQNNGNANINYKQNRLSIGANLGSNFAWPQTSLVELNQVSTAPAATLRQTSSAETKRYGTIGSANVGYDFNDFNSITTNIRVNGGGFKTNGETQNFNTELPNSPNYFSNNNNQISFSGFDWNADYTRKFKKQGEELTIAGQWSHSKIANDYNTNFSGLANEYFVRFPNQKGDNDGKNDEYTAQADYVLPISAKVKLEAGAKSIFRRINSDYNIYQQYNEQGIVDNEGNYTLNPVASNKYDYSQDVYAGYSVLSFTLPKNYALQIGGRLESTHINGDPSNATQASLTPFSQTYNNFIPSFILSKTVKNTQTYKLTYNKRIQRPSLQYLNPFINRANPNVQTQGTPELSPEITQTVELGYNTFIKSSVINFSVYYKHTSDLIEGIAQSIVDPELGDDPSDPNAVRRIRTTYQNIGTNNSVGASFFGSINPWKPLTIRGSLNGYTYNPNASGAQRSQQSSTGTYFQYNAFMSASAVIKGGWTGEFFGVFNSSRRTIQGENPAFNLFGFGLKKEIIEKKFTLGLNALSPFQKYLRLNTNITGNSFTQSQKVSYPLRSFGISFTYNFGKMNFNQQGKKKGVKNDDLMQGGDQGGMGGGPGAGGR